jgi:putative oxidoreductase
MQRLFTSFPGGPPGAGLFLLRSTLGVIGVIEAGLLLKHDGRIGFAAAAIVGGSAAVLLVLGFLTPAAGLSLGLSSAALWTAGDTPLSWPQGAMTLHLVGSSAAIALLGPGAYSIDARLFGRREIVVGVERPSRSPRPPS